MYLYKVVRTGHCLEGRYTMDGIIKFLDDMQLEFEITYVQQDDRRHDFKNCVYIIECIDVANDTSIMLVKDIETPYVDKYGISMERYDWITAK